MQEISILPMITMTVGKAGASIGVRSYFFDKKIMEMRAITTYQSAELLDTISPMFTCCVMSCRCDEGVNLMSYCPTM